jgi:phage portal protein BeeE
VSTLDQVGPVWFGPSEHIELNGQLLDPRNVVQFISPTPGVLFTGSRMIDIAIRLDTAARRFATSEIAAGYLQSKPGGDPMDADDLAALASAWSTARQTNAIGALNEFVEWKEFSADPSKLQLTEGREYSALELSRVANVPPYLLGISTGGMTYQNAQEAVRQLWLLGARPIMCTIEETLSLDTVLPRGRRVRFDLSDIIGTEVEDDIDVVTDRAAVLPEVD